MQNIVIAEFIKPAAENKKCAARTAWAGKQFILSFWLYSISTNWIRMVQIDESLLRRYNMLLCNPSNEDDSSYHFVQEGGAQRHVSFNIEGSFPASAKSRRNQSSVDPTLSRVGNSISSTQFDRWLNFCLLPCFRHLTVDHSQNRKSSKIEGPRLFKSSEHYNMVLMHLK